MKAKTMSNSDQNSFFKRFKRFSIILVFVLLLSSFSLPSSAFAQSSMTIRINENDLNQAVRDLRLSGRDQKTLTTRFFPDISVTVDWLVRNFHLDINPDQILMTVEVDAKNGENTRIPFTYTNKVSGEAFARIEGNQLLIDITALKVPIYAKNPFGNNRIELTKINLVNSFDNKNIAVDLPFQESYTLNIPEVGEKRLVLGQKVLKIENDALAITSEFFVDSQFN